MRKICINFSLWWFINPCFLPYLVAHYHGVRRGPWCRKRSPISKWPSNRKLKIKPVFEFLWREGVLLFVGVFYHFFLFFCTYNYLNSSIFIESICPLLKIIINKNTAVLKSVKKDFFCNIAWVYFWRMCCLHMH